MIHKFIVRLEIDGLVSAKESQYIADRIYDAVTRFRFEGELSPVDCDALIAAVDSVDPY